MPKTTEARAMIRLCPCGPNQDWVQVEDEDSFLTTLEAVVHARKACGKLAEVGRQLRQLVRKLQGWLNANGDDVREAYLTPRDTSLLFLLVRKTKKFNMEFEDGLTDLSLDIAQDESFDLIHLTALALPATSQESVDSFLPPPAHTEVSDAQ